MNLAELTSENGGTSLRLHGNPPTGRGRRSSGRLSAKLVDKSVYELAAFVPDLDTVEVTDKVKADLLANNIGQKVCIELKELSVRNSKHHHA